jgi:hypothetical protein
MKDDSSERRDQANPETAAGSDPEAEESQSEAPDAKQFETETDEELPPDQAAMQPDSE